MESYERLKKQKNDILAREAIKITSCVVNRIVNQRNRLCAILGILRGTPALTQYWSTHRKFMVTVDKELARAEGNP